MMITILLIIMWVLSGIDTATTIYWINNKKIKEAGPLMKYFLKKDKNPFLALLITKLVVLGIPTWLYFSSGKLTVIITMVLSILITAYVIVRNIITASKGG